MTPLAELLTEDLAKSVLPTLTATGRLAGIALARQDEHDSSAAAALAGELAGLLEDLNTVFAGWTVFGLGILEVEKTGDTDVIRAAELLIGRLLTTEARPGTFLGRVRIELWMRGRGTAP